MPEATAGVTRGEEINVPSVINIMPLPQKNKDLFVIPVTYEGTIHACAVVPLDQKKPSMILSIRLDDERFGTLICEENGWRCHPEQPKKLVDLIIQALNEYYKREALLLL